MIKVLIERDIAEGLEVPYEEVARRVLSALGPKEPPRRYARVRLNDDDATGGDIEMTLA